MKTGSDNKLDDAFVKAFSGLNTQQRSIVLMMLGLSLWFAICKLYKKGRDAK